MFLEKQLKKAFKTISFEVLRYRISEKFASAVEFLRGLNGQSQPAAKAKADELEAFRTQLPKLFQSLND